MKVFSIRHGESIANVEKIRQGQTHDTSLTTSGKQQIEKACEHLPSDIDLIISSPLKRARESAEIIANKFGNDPKNIIIRSELNEKDIGSIAGLHKSEAQNKLGLEGQRLTRGQRLHFDYSHYGGESYEQLKSRVMALMKDILNNYRDKKILFVTSGGIIRVMHELFGSAEIDELKVENLCSRIYN